LAPALTKKTQIPPITVQPPVQQQQPQPPNYSSVNSIVPPIVQPQPQGNANLPQQPQQPPVVNPPNGGILPPLGTGGISTSQRPYVAPRLRNNGLGISRAPSTPGPIQIPGQPGLVGNNNPQQTPNFRTSIFGGGSNRPNTLRSRGLKY